MKDLESILIQEIVLDIFVPDDFFGTDDVLSFIAEMQGQVLDSSDNVVIIHLANIELLNDKTILFLLSCLDAFGRQKSKKVKFLVNSSSNPNVESVELSLLKEVNDVVRLVTDNVSRNLPIKTTEKMEEILVSLIAEVYNNAKEHSEAKCIVGNCYTDTRDFKKRLCFCCYDTGIGIIESVRRFLGKDSDEAFKGYKIGEILLNWALKKGNSTKKQPRGAGLDWLLDFAKLNKGRIRVCSEDVLFEQNFDGIREFKQLKKKFSGSFFEMNILEDPDAVYKLKGEI